LYSFGAVLQGAVEMSQSHYENHTVAERYIIDLLIEFVTSNCTGQFQESLLSLSLRRKVSRFTRVKRDDKLLLELVVHFSPRLANFLIAFLRRYAPVPVPNYEN